MFRARVNQIGGIHGQIYNSIIPSENVGKRRATAADALTESSAKRLKSEGYSQAIAGARRRRRRKKKVSRKKVVKKKKSCKKKKEKSTKT